MKASVLAVFALVLASGTGYAEAGPENGYVVFEHPAMENLPTAHVPAPEAIHDTISCALARGEYEPVQIGVHALTGGLANIRITVVSDLEVITYHRIDPGIKQQLALEPETVVPEQVPSEVYLQRGDVVAELAEGQSVNFWLLLHADRETPAGVHEGKIRLEPEGRDATELELRVRVRPFELAPPRAVFAAYFREDMLPARLGSWDLEDQVARAIYRDMAAHGQNSVSFYHAGDYRTQLPPENSRMVETSLALALEAGLARPEIPCVAVQASIVGPEISAAQMEAAVAWLQAERRRRGWPEIIIFGRDEGMYPALGLREYYAPLRPLPIRLSTDMSHISPAYAYGDIHDVWTLHDGLLTPEFRAEAERMGAELWTYSYRIWRQNYSPACQRYYAGLHTWAHRIGGNWIWAYSHVRHSQVWWMPEGSEPMPITGWEGRREGVDDYRYLQMVEDLVSENPRDPVASQAGAWLEALRARLTLTTVQPHEVVPGTPLELAEYDEIRATAAEFIQRLGPLEGRAEPPKARRLKDEAAAYRGRSVEECVAGLEGRDASRRRAAAWALSERGPEAARATPALVRLLANPETRFPALHAIDAIGPEAYPAAPEVASLLSHPDAFVRQGATFALAGIARPRNWDERVNGYAAEDVSPYAHTVVPALRQALRDSHDDVVWIAGYGLARCGEAAAPALPEVVEMADSEVRSDNCVAALRALCGMGPAAAAAVPFLVQAYAAGKGEDRTVARVLAAIGPAAADAVPVLEQYRTPEHPYLAEVCYALFCIRGDRSDLETMAGLLGDETCPRGDSEWEDVVTFLNALGARAAPVAPMVKERLDFLDSRPALRSSLEATFFARVKEGAKPLRLLPR